MKRSWNVQRTTHPHPDGQRRWDRAYQLLLRWDDDAPASHQPHVSQEDDHADCSLRSGFDQPSTADPHD